jgi:hypothetical protein
MAKSKSKFKLNSKQFFTLTLLSVMALGLIVVTMAVQKPTNTHSDAAGICSVVPAIRLLDSKDSSNSVTYNLRIKNNNPDSCTRITYGLKVTGLSDRWDYGFTRNSIVHQGWVGDTLRSGNYDDWSLWVAPRSGVTNGTHYFNVKACKAVSEQIYGAYVMRNTDNCSSISLKYIKN